MTITEIKSMPVSERIILMEEIWDTLCHETEEIPSPDWHEEILKSRLEMLRTNLAEVLTLQDLKNTNK